MRAAFACGALFSAVVLCAQFPHTRVLEVRVGQERPAIDRIVQDHQGSIWIGSGKGLIRTDGEQVYMILRTEQARVTALVAMDKNVVVALSDGHILTCGALGCDTLMVDTMLRSTPVRSMTISGDDELLLGTYGSGVWSLKGDEVIRIDGTVGLPDDHVNDLCMLSDGRIVAATDQGLAVISVGKVVEVFGEAEGATDNLVLSVASDGDAVWAGTDRSGPYRWIPGKGLHSTWSPVAHWTGGRVISLAVRGDYLWLGTERDGMIMYDLGDPIGGYHQHGPDTREASVKDVLLEENGSAIWCTGNERLHRADPSVLVVPEHEGLDLRNITALAYDPDDRIWFATAQGLFHHAAAFAEGLTVTRVPLRIDARTPVVSLAAGMDGTMWVATFGQGVFAIRPDGKVEHFTEHNGLINDNVLVVRTLGASVWFGTLAGASELRDGVFHDHVPEGSGFIYDLLPLEEGGVLCATDGAGVVRVPLAGGDALASDGPRTYYSIIRDSDGRVWAAGPGTGLCAIDDQGVKCTRGDRPPFDGSLFSLGSMGGHVLVFGSTGVSVYDPSTGRWLDMTARTGLENIEAQLNTVCKDARGAVWLACDKGMIRIRPTPELFKAGVPTVITGMESGSEAIAMLPDLQFPHDRNDITFHYSGIHYADPGALRFEVRLSGHDERSVITRDREMAWSGLAPGSYRFMVRAFTGEEMDEGEWASFKFTIDPPWWTLPWVILIAIAAVILVAVALLRAHDRRLRERERMESERVRFQLEALRSQVDPHFLFNSFNTLMELITTDADLALDHVERLSTFFRNILLVRDRDLITLEEELRLLDTYFSLERIRFGKAIELKLDIGVDPEVCQVVPMTLQLLVENALKHNTATPSEPLVVEVFSEGDRLVVRNHLRPKLSPPRSTGFGLDTIRKRYASITGAPIEVEHGRDRFTVRIPLMYTEP